MPADENKQPRYDNVAICQSKIASSFSSLSFERSKKFHFCLSAVLPVAVLRSNLISNRCGARRSVQRQRCRRKKTVMEKALENANQRNTDNV